MAKAQRGLVNWSVREANDALTELKEALALAGVSLPSLGLEHAAMATGQPSPLVELGRARPDTISDLAKVIRKGAENG